MRVLYTLERSGREHPTVPWEVVDVDRRMVRAGMIPLALSGEAKNLSRFSREWVYEGRTLGTSSGLAYIWA